MFVALPKKAKTIRMSVAEILKIWDPILSRILEKRLQTHNTFTFLILGFFSTERFACQHIFQVVGYTEAK